MKIQNPKRIFLDVTQNFNFEHPPRQQNRSWRDHRRARACSQGADRERCGRGLDQLRDPRERWRTEATTDLRQRVRYQQR